MRYSIKIPLFILTFFILTCLYGWSTVKNEWVGVFWASYKNMTIIGCLYFLYQRAKILHTDKIFIGGAMITSSIQSAMYVLCPFSTEAQKYLYFDLYNWFVVLIGMVCITLHIKELWRRH